MKKIIVLLAIVLTACAPALVKSAPQPQAPTKTTYVLVEEITVPTRAPSETPTPTEIAPTATATIVQKGLPHIKETPYQQIPNHPPAAMDTDTNGEGFMVDTRYAYFEQMVCNADYVDLRWGPYLTQPPKAYVVYGDVVEVDDREGEWAHIYSGYWIQLKYLCNF